MAHRQSFKPVRAPHADQESTSSKFRHDLGFLHDSKAVDASEPTHKLNLDALKRSKQTHSSAHNSLDANYPAQKPFSRSSAASARTSTAAMPDQAASNSSPANHFRGAPAFVLPSSAFGVRPASATASISIHDRESLFTQSGPGPVIPAFQQRPASAAPPASNTMHHDMPPPRAFSRAAQRPGSAAPPTTAHQNGFLGHGHAQSQQTNQWRPSQHQQDEQMMDFSMEDGFDGLGGEGEGEAEGEMMGMGMDMMGSEDQENIPPSHLHSGDRGSRYHYVPSGGPGSEREASAPISQSGSGIGGKRERGGSAMADEEDDLYAGHGENILGGIRAQKRMRFHDELDQQSQQPLGSRAPSSTYDRNALQPQSQPRLQNPAAALHTELDTFYAFESARVAQLREKWTKCSLEEWKDVGEELNKKFGELTVYVQEYMAKKIAHFTSLQSRTFEHATELDRRDEQLREARKMLVSRTGALVDHDADEEEEAKGEEVGADGKVGGEKGKGKVGEEGE